MDLEEKRAKQAAAMRAWRAKRRAQGLPVCPPMTDEQRARVRDRMRRRRAEAAAAGITLACDDWHLRNPDKHRARVRSWRERNLEYKRAIDRDAQAERRSTPWGRINNNMTAIMHYSVRRNVSSSSKYTAPLGYTWADLRAYLERQFTPEMNWENWGDVWELDHIVPLSSFKYTSLDDPLFRECWRLDNLRPLGRFENNSKGSRG